MSKFCFRNGAFLFFGFQVISQTLPDPITNSTLNFGAITGNYGPRCYTEGFHYGIDYGLPMGQYCFRKGSSN